MKPRRKVSSAGLERIKQFEGLRRSAARLADGRWTVGYGHVKFAREGAEITEKDAEALLIYDLLEVATAVDELVFTPLSQNQFDALVSFASNIGVDQFKGSSVLRRLNEGEVAKAAFALEVWRRAPFEDEAIVVDALVRRRAAEKALFLTPDDGFVPAPTPVLPPEVDHDVEPKAPAGEPVQLEIPLDGAVAEIRRASGALQAGPAPSQVTARAEAAAERLRAVAPDPIVEQAAPLEAVPSDSEITPFPAAGQAEEAAPQAAPPIRTPGLRTFPRPRVRRDNLAPALGLALAGVIAFGFAIFRGLDAGATEGVAENAQALSYLAGIAGIICIFAAAYMLLDRFAGEDD